MGCGWCWGGEYGGVGIAEGVESEAVGRHNDFSGEEERIGIGVVVEVGDLVISIVDRPTGWMSGDGECMQ